MRVLKLKFAFVLFLFLFPFELKAQYEAILNMAGKALDFGNQLIEMKKINETLSQTKKTIENGKNLIDKVNSQIEKLNYVIKIKKATEDIIKEVSKARKYIDENRKFLSKETLEDFEFRIKNVLSSIKEIKEVVSLLLKSDALKMNDYERIKSVEEKIEKIEKKKQDLKEKNEELQNEIGFKKFKEKFNSIRVFVNEGRPSIMVGNFNLIKIVDDYFQKNAYKYALMLAKFVAVMFIIVQFFIKYFNSRIDTVKKDLGLSLSDFTRPMIYIFLICYFPTILNYLDKLVVSFFEPLNKMSYGFDELFDKKDIEVEKSGKGIFSSAIFYALNYLISLIILVFDAGYYLSFILVRTFLLGLTNLIFPFLLAFSALEICKEYVSKGFKVYFTVVVLLYIIHLSFGIGNEIYTTLLNTFGTDTEGGSLSRTFGKITCAFIAILIKLSFTKQGTRYIFRLLN